MLHEEKKIVPDPPVPTRGNSSPKCGQKLATFAYLPVLQNPAVPIIRSAPHLLGQILHSFSSERDSAILVLSSPVSWSLL